MMNTRHIILVLFVFTLLAGCTAVSPEPSVASGMDMPAFISRLETAGAVVMPEGKVSHDSDTQIIKVNSEDVWLDEYEDEAAAIQAAGIISPDGGQVTIPDPENPDAVTVTIVEWIGTPHFYRSGRIIVRYIGDNREMMSLLESILGPQFAGGKSEEKLRLEVGVIEPAAGAPMSFEEAFQQAENVVLAEVTAVTPGPIVYTNPEKTWCQPVQWVTLHILKVYKGSLVVNQEQAIFQSAGVTDTDTGCGDNPDAEKMMRIMEHDPLYEVNQRYLLSFSPLANKLDPDPGMAAANAELYRLVEIENPGQVLLNGRLLVEQGGHSTLDQADVVHVAYDDYGRTIPGTPTGKSLADYEALLMAPAEITIDSVQVGDGQIRFAGSSSLPDGTCLQTELLANEAAASWWPSTCTTVQNGSWDTAVPLGAAGAPVELDAAVTFTLTAWQQDDPTIISETFVFDLAGPPPSEG